MGNNFLEDKLNEQTGNKYGFKLKCASLDKVTSLCHVELFYNDGVILSALDRGKCENIVKQTLPEGFKYEVKFIKNFVVNESVGDYVKQFFKKNFPSIMYELKTVDCENIEKKVQINVLSKMTEYINNRGVKKELEKDLYENFSAEIEVVFSEVREEIEVVEVESENLQIFDDTPIERFIEVTDVEAFVGEIVDSMAFYIKDKTTPNEEVVFCGKVLYVKEYSYTPKSKKKDDNKDENKITDKSSESAENTEGSVVNDEPVAKNERKYFKFALEDFTGKINCVFFANKNNLEQIQKLVPGQTIVLNGKLEDDKFSGGVSLRVKNISLCKLPESFEEKINWKEEPLSYKSVFPEKMEMYAQQDLFSMGDRPVNKFLLEHDVVVFDFETTGLNLDGSDKIIEIGAVKMHEGKIIERFMSYIDPEMKLPAKITELTGITDEDLVGAPTYDCVLPDFYKFTRGCYLSGYNIVGFDCVFLNYFGKQCCYKFDNPIVDVYNLAQKYVKGTKNLKLGTVAEKLGVELDNAHRAVYDAIATAEVLIKISEYAEIGE